MAFIVSLSITSTALATETELQHYQGAEAEQGDRETAGRGVYRGCPDCENRMANFDMHINPPAVANQAAALANGEMPELTPARTRSGR